MDCGDDNDTPREHSDYDDEGDNNMPRDDEDDGYNADDISIGNVDVDNLHIGSSDEEDNPKFTNENSISVVHLKNMLPKECSLDKVKSIIMERFDSYDSSKKEATTEGLRGCFDKEEFLQSNDRDDFRFLQYRVKSKKKSEPDETDVNHGSIKFFYWQPNNGGPVKLYALSKTRKSNAWLLLSGYRDTKFPRKFAMAFMDPTKIRSVVIRYLAGQNAGKTEIKYMDLSSFNPGNITECYGFVEQIEGKISKNECGQKLLELCDLNRPDDAFADMKIGQVTFRTRTGSENHKDRSRKDHFSLIKFLSEEVITNENDAYNEHLWNFLTYIRRPDNKTIQMLRKEILKDIFEIYESQNFEDCKIKMENGLSYYHQDNFDSAEVTLQYGSKDLHWDDDKEPKYGKSITVKDVFQALQNNKVQLEKSSNVKNILLSFTDIMSGQDIKQKFAEMLTFQKIISSDNEKKFIPGSYFIVGNLYFKVEQDTLFELYARFSRAVKETLITQEELVGKKNPTILPWCTKDNRSFTTRELWEYCRVNGDDNLDFLKESTLAQALTDDREMLSEQGNHLVTAKYQDIPRMHTREILDANALIMTKSELGKGILKALQKSSASPETKQATLNRIGCILISDGKLENIRVKLKEYITRESYSKESISKIYHKMIPNTKKEEFNDPKSKNGRSILKLLSIEDCDENTNDNEKLLQDILHIMENAERKKMEHKYEDTIQLLMNRKSEKKDKCKEILKELKKPRPCIKGVGNYRFTVESPYLVIDILKKTIKLEICPLKLIQFFRMHIPMSEGLYNELYHFSNCKCQDSKWKYVVGDRILDRSSNGIELFDVMAYSEEEVYLLHVKKDFDANACRAACSQIRVAGEQIWKALTTNSLSQTIFGKFYKVAMKDSPTDIHKQLTSFEIKRFVADTEQGFIEKMSSGILKIFLCFTTCVSDPKCFNNIKTGDIKHKFTENEFPDKATFQKLKDAGMLNPDSSCATIQAFGTQKDFVDSMSTEGLNQRVAESTYKNIHKHTGGGTKSYLTYGSFPAKVEFVELHTMFKTRLTSYATDRVSLKLITVPQPEKPLTIPKTPVRTPNRSKKKKSEEHKEISIADYFPGGSKAKQTTPSASTSTNI